MPPEKPDDSGAEAGQRRDAARKPIWEVFAEIVRTIPEEELRKLPVDGATQHDHYIYGTPKREEPEDGG